MWVIESLLALREYIGKDNSTAAQHIAKHIIKAVKLLVDNQEMGRIGRIENTREFILSGTPYIIAYRIKNNSIEILRIFHGAMKWPDKL